MRFPSLPELQLRTLFFTIGATDQKHQICTLVAAAIFDDQCSENWPSFSERLMLRFIEASVRHGGRCRLIDQSPSAEAFKCERRIDRVRLVMRNRMRKHMA
jgi:hypothetical protein